MSLVSSLNAASAPESGEPTVVRTMHIGELADRAEMSLRTIRHYDEVDLLRPSVVHLWFTHTLGARDEPGMRKR